jgi:hypothetical protein
MESRVANALDKLEAQIQHNEGDLTTWLKWEKRHVFAGLAETGLCHPSVSTLRESIVHEATEKIGAGGSLRSLSEELEWWRTATVRPWRREDASRPPRKNQARSIGSAGARPAKRKDADWHYSQPILRKARLPYASKSLLFASA